MKISYAKSFTQSFLKLPEKKQIKVRNAVNLFIREPNNPKLRLHELQGPLAGVWSISAGGDLRLHFEYHGKTAVFFLTVGTHSQLY